MEESLYGGQVGIEGSEISEFGFEISDLRENFGIRILDCGLKKDF